MRDRNRSAHHQRDVESIQKLVARDSSICALFDVISDAIVASEDDRSGQSHQFLRLLVERAIFVRLRVKRKEPLYPEMITAQQFLVHFRAITIKVVHENLAFHLNLQASEFITQGDRARIAYVARVNALTASYARGLMHLPSPKQKMSAANPEIELAPAAVDEPQLCDLF